MKGDTIIVRAGNRVKIDEGPTQHAEIVAIRDACKRVGKRHLEGCVIYTTHEPCPMCTSAAIWARMKGIIFGARMADMMDYRTRNGNVEWSWRTITMPSALIAEKGDPKIVIVGEFMREECKTLFHS